MTEKAIADIINQSKTKKPTANFPHQEMINNILELQKKREIDLKDMQNLMDMI